MQAGEKAPFAGVLVTDGLLAKIKTDGDKASRLLKLEIEKLTRENRAEKETHEVICNASIQAEQSKTDACTSDRERQRSIYENIIKSKSCPNPVWHYLSFVGGAVVAGGICVGATRVK